MKKFKDTFLGICLALIILLNYCAYPQRTPTGIVDYQRNSIQSPMNFGLTNTGIIGLFKDKTQFGLEYPRGSGNSYLFNAGMMYCFHTRFIDSVYNPYDIYGLFSYNNFKLNSYLKPFVYKGVNDSLEYSRIYFSTDYKDNGVPITGSGNSYPVWRSKVNNNSIWVDDPNDRIPNSIRSNKFKASDEDIVCKFDDSDTSKYILYDPSIKLMPIGNTVEQHVYTFFTGPLQNTIIVRYLIKNNFRRDYEIFGAGYNLDPDIGSNGENDYGRMYATDTTLNLQIVWSGSESKSVGYLGAGIIDAPYSIDGHIVVQKGTPNSKPIPVNVNSIVAKNNTDTLSNIGVLKSMRLYYKDWKQVNTDVYLRQGFYDCILKPGDSFEFAYALVVANPAKGSIADGTDADVENLVQSFRRVKAAYAAFKETGYLTDIQEDQFVPSQEVVAYPSPANTTLYINPINVQDTYQVQMYNIQGDNVLNSTCTQGETINVQNLPNGVYRVVILSNASQYSFMQMILH